MRKQNGARMALMTLKSKSKVCGTYTKSRMELGCALITLTCKSKVRRLYKLEQNGGWMRINPIQARLFLLFKGPRGGGGVGTPL